MRMESHSCSQRSISKMGWMSRNNLPSGRGKVFFLTSLFIELIEDFEREMGGVSPTSPSRECGYPAASYRWIWLGGRRGFLPFWPQ